MTGLMIKSLGDVSNKHQMIISGAVGITGERQDENDESDASVVCLVYVTRLNYKAVGDIITPV